MEYSDRGDVDYNYDSLLVLSLYYQVILIMEYLDGGELFERVAGEDFNLTESDCCQFMKQICRYPLKVFFVVILPVNAVLVVIF